jgi:hypothetical protein
MTHESNDKRNVVVRIQPQEPEGTAQPSVWRRFVSLTQHLFTVGLWGGTHAATAKVGQMEAHAQKVAAEASKTRAHAAGIELQNTSRMLKLLDEIVTSKDAPAIKLAKLQLLRETHPQLGSALDQLHARYEAILSQGGSIAIVPEKTLTLPPPPRRLRKSM